MFALWKKNGHHAPTYTVKLDRQSGRRKTVPWNKKNGNHDSHYAVKLDRYSEE